MKNAQIELIGYACGIGAGKVECEQGPLYLKNSGSLDKLSGLIWNKILQPVDSSRHKEALQSIATLSLELAKITAELVAQRKFFITIGGDHSSAIGTWSGVATALRPLSLGLLWVDAHLDSHTMETTPSGNIHGMPLAALLGQGDTALTSILSREPKIKPENTCVLGVRSYEQEEQKLLQELGVRIFYMEEIIEKGMDAVIEEAHAIISNNTDYFGVSIDLDAVTPEEAPGVGTPEPNGISIESLIAGLQKLNEDPKLIGAEIVEFNPTLDKNQQTELLIVAIVKEFIKSRSKGSYYGKAAA